MKTPELQYTAEYIDYIIDKRAEICEIKPENVFLKSQKKRIHFKKANEFIEDFKTNYPSFWDFVSSLKIQHFLILLETETKKPEDRK